MITSDRGKVMLTYLPWYYEKSQIMAAILNSQGQELDSLLAALDDIIDQTYIDRATWGLDIWEAEYGIISNPSDTLYIRRKRLTDAKKFQAVSTRQFIEQLVNQYTFNQTGQVYNLAEQYRIKTVFRFDESVDWKALRTLIHLFKPAHLLHVMNAIIAFDMALSVQNRCLLHMKIKSIQNFWSGRSGARWDGRNKWDGSVQWGAGVALTQKHYVNISVVVRATSSFSNVTDTWNGSFLWDGMRTWGNHAAANTIKLTTITNGEEVGSELL